MFDVTRRSIIKALFMIILTAIIWKWNWFLSWARKISASSAISVPSKALPIAPKRLPKFEAKQLLYQFKVKGQAPTDVVLKLTHKGRVLFFQNIKLVKGRNLDDYPQIKYSQEQDVSIVTVALSPEYASYHDLKVKPTNITVSDQRLVPQLKTKMIKNMNPIEGYTPKISYQPGETVQLKVHTLHKQFNISICRYGLKEEVLMEIPQIKGMRQDYPAYAYREGCNWKTSYEFQIPENWKPGLYSAKISDDSKREFYITWIIRPKKLLQPISSDEKRKRIAILASTNTWQAYNPWGGASLYAYKEKPRFQRDLPDQVAPKFAQYVSTQRPNYEGRPVPRKGEKPSHLATGERYVYAWFEREKISYDLYSDLDLHQDPSLLDSYGTLCIQTHGEYWTKEMYDQLETFLDRGGSLIYLSGNGIYWKTVIRDNLMEVRKDGEIHRLNGEKGGKWRSLQRPESRLLGVRYTTPGIRTYAPYRVLNPEHWIFEGTGVKKGDLIGKKGPGGAASGHETDKRDIHSPANVVLLAKGLNPNQDPLLENDRSLPVTTEKGLEVGKGGGEIVYYDHPKGGGVFSVGSTTYGTSMWVDPILSKMLRNVVKRFTGI